MDVLSDIADLFRLLMRRVPAPVTVITAEGGGEVRGMTAGSFASVSLDPVLVSFNVMNTSRMHGILQQTNRVAINFLSDQQAPLSEHFARPDLDGEEQFRSVAFESVHGLPVLSESVGAVLCEVRTVLETGDHSLFVAEVVQVVPGKEGTTPLVYFDQSYFELGVPVLITPRSVVNGGSGHSPLAPAPKKAKS